MRFAEKPKKFTCRTYIIVETLFNTSKIEMIYKKKFVKPTFNINLKSFFIYVLVSKITTNYFF